MSNMSSSSSTSSSSGAFALSESFVDLYRDLDPGFDGLGALVYSRTYSRLKADGTKEEWYETVERVVNGVYNMMKQRIERNGLGWIAAKAQRSAQEMFGLIYHRMFTPPGRGLWAMGSALTEERHLFMALNNCAFVSTEFGWIKPSEFLMDCSMLGVGTGFDTKGAGKFMIHAPRVGDDTPRVFVIPDSREGWVASVIALENTYGEPNQAWIEFDYSQLRPEGAPIVGFGGTASGFAPLKELHDAIRRTLAPLAGKFITVTAITDIMNCIGRCVVAGNVRRTAEIAFGDPKCEEYLDLKDYKKNPERADYGWTSNNSVFATLGMDYEPVCERIRNNGEPGFAWLENMRGFGRMNGVADGRDYRAGGGNPCLEQTLESYELCCLVETFPARHTCKADFLRTLKFAYLYAKTVTLGETHWCESNRVMLRNRRIGCSVSGIAQFLGKHRLHTLKEWLEAGYAEIQRYDVIYSEWFAIPRSIKTTSVKPSGTVSLLAGSTPGIHYPESRFYIRRVRVAKNSELVEALIRSGHHVEPSVSDPDRTVVVEFPMDAGAGVRTSKEVSAWEQMALHQFMQKYWSDNQVSHTVTFDPETEGKDLKHILDYSQYGVKGVSFLPRVKLGAYAQMPYEEIDEKTYTERKALVKSVRFGKGGKDATVERFCDGGQCGVAGE